MSIVINNQEVGATDLIEAPEISVKEIQFTATDLNEATNILRATLDTATTLANGNVYCFAIDCGEFEPNVGTKIYLTDYNETIENTSQYYNSVTNTYKFYILREDNTNKPIADVTSVVKKVGGGGGDDIIDISTPSEMSSKLSEENVGKVYRFIGDTTADYVNGDLYEVEEA